MFAIVDEEIRIRAIGSCVLARVRVRCSLRHSCFLSLRLRALASALPAPPPNRFQVKSFLFSQIRRRYAKGLVIDMNFC